VRVGIQGLSLFKKHVFSDLGIALASTPDRLAFWSFLDLGYPLSQKYALVYNVNAVVTRGIYSFFELKKINEGGCTRWFLIQIQPFVPSSCQGSGDRKAVFRCLRLCHVCGERGTLWIVLVVCSRRHWRFQTKSGQKLACHRFRNTPSAQPIRSSFSSVLSATLYLAGTMDDERQVVVAVDSVWRRPIPF
jgi:hypothetical protein